MISAVSRSSRTMPPRYAKRSERMSGAIRGLRSLVLKIRCTTRLPQVWATVLSPFQGLLPDFTFTQGLRPGLQSVAASRLNDCGIGHCRRDVTDITMRRHLFLRSRNDARPDNLHLSEEAERASKLQPRRGLHRDSHFGNRSHFFPRIFLPSFANGYPINR